MIRQRQKDAVTGVFPRGEVDGSRRNDDDDDSNGVVENKARHSDRHPAGRDEGRSPAGLVETEAGGAPSCVSRGVVGIDSRRRPALGRRHRRRPRQSRRPPRPVFPVPDVGGPLVRPDCPRRVLRPPRRAGGAE